jgi:hypothetical protein
MSAEVDAPQRQLPACQAGRGDSKLFQGLAAVSALTVFSLLCACGHRQPGTSQLSTDAASSGAVRPPMAQSQSAEFHYDDPCSLLTPAEVEAAFGAPLGTAPYRGSDIDPEPNGSDCVYQTANFQTVTLHVEFDGGQQAYHIGDFIGGLVKGSNAVNASAKKAMVSEDGSEIAGEWDEAKLTPFNCCIFNALLADQMITIDFTGSTLTLKQAAGLVDAALKRLKKPLSLDGGANVAAARTFLKTRPRRMDPCSVLTQAEVEAIVGRLAAAPKAQGDDCSYALPQQPGFPPRIYDLQFEWSGGNYQFRQDLHAAGMAGAALGGMTIQTQTQVQVPNTGAGGSRSPSSGTQTKEVNETISLEEASRRTTGETFSQATHLTGKEDAVSKGPWERIANAGPGLEAVKKDVLVKIGLYGVDKDRARALLAAAMNKF